MIPDLSPIFSQYEKLRDQVDQSFAQVQARHPELVACHRGCSDCCHALFDLSLVEAMYINKAFTETFGYGPERSAIVSRADEIDRKLARLKRDLFREEKKGVDPNTIMGEVAGTKMPCPLLGEDNLCILYNARPLTCRIYGIPSSIAGETHVCGFSGFAQGGSYPTIRLEKIQKALFDMSIAIEQAIGSRFDKLHEVYMPLSMALLTNFNEDFLGVGPAKRER